MNSRRTARVAQAIRQVVSSTILFELRDPRVQGVTVLGVEVAEDLRSAKVNVTVFGEPKKQRLAMHGLNASCGFLQSKIAEELDLRYTPLLSFTLDQGVKRSVEISRQLRELQPAEQNDADMEEASDLDEFDAPAAVEDQPAPAGGDASQA